MIDIAGFRNMPCVPDGQESQRGNACWYSTYNTYSTYRFFNASKIALFRSNRAL